MGDAEYVCLLVEELEEKSPLGRSKCWWMDNIKLDLGKIVRDSVD
jgi:hypothetical protein